MKTQIDVARKQIKFSRGAKLIDILNAIRKVDRKNWEQYTIEESIIIDQNPNEEGWKNNVFDSL